MSIEQVIVGIITSSRPLHSWLSPESLVNNNFDTGKVKTEKKKKKRGGQISNTLSTYPTCLKFGDFLINIY